jgi:hypothetical protein
MSLENISEIKEGDLKEVFDALEEAFDYFASTLVCHKKILRFEKEGCTSCSY